MFTRAAQWGARHGGRLPLRARAKAIVVLVSLSLCVACGSTKRNQAHDSPPAAAAGGNGNSGGASSTSSSSVTGSIVVSGGGSGADGPLGECRREVSFEGVTLETPPAFDVVIVADNSESLSWSREDLAQGLSELMENVYGHAVRFFVLTPTQYDETSAQAIELRTGEELVNWRDSVTGEPYTHAVTRYVQSCTDALGQELLCPGYPAPDLEFDLEGTWEFVMPEPVAHLDSDMTLAALEAERNKVVEAILALGTQGSSEEQPLCTLTRYLDQPARLLPDRAVFLVISDEDDTASVDSCLAKYSYSQVPSSSSLVEGCTQNCDSYRFYVTRQVSQHTLEFVCAPVDDFGNIGSEDTWRTDTLPIAGDDTCEGLTEQPCTSDEEARAQAVCDGGFIVQRCLRSCVDGARTDYCGYSSADDTLDLCATAFEAGGTRYANIADYCETTRQQTGWGPCNVTGYTLEDVPATWSKSGGARPLVQANTLQDMIYLFHADARRAFGEENYFVDTILFTREATCEPQAGQSYATELAQLATSPEHVHPICESYAPVFSTVKAFARGLLQTEYPLELGERESIEAVVVENRDGNTRELEPADYDYDEDENLLYIDEGALRASDLGLSVQVVDPCAPPIK